MNQTLVVPKDWGKWTGNIDLGYALPMGNKRVNYRGTFSIDFAIGYQILPWLQPEIELNYSLDTFADENDAQTLAVAGGLVMPVDETLRINIGVQQGIWGENSYKATSIVTAVKYAFLEHHYSAGSFF